jgi:hypothetical protein
MLVIVETPDGERETWTLDEVLPHAFGPSFLQE